MIYKFLFKRRSESPASLFKPQQVNELPGPEADEGLYLVSPSGCTILETPLQTTVLLGDTIFGPVGSTSQFTGDEPIADYFKSIKGTYYLIRIHKQEDRIEFASSIFGIFPVYYHDHHNGQWVSSDLSYLIDHSQIPLTVNKRFILELLLFYYPLFDQLIYKEISNLPSNSVLTFKGKEKTISKYLEISDYFTNNPLPYRNYTGLLADLFISNAKDYFPDELFYITFTGGFDGRTLVACAKNAGCNFKTYSIGDLTSDDITIPMADAKALGIDYQPVYLDNPEYKEQFLELGSRLVYSSGLMDNMLYTHFPYAADIISDKSNFILTGFGGSEIFRALDIRGAVTSHELVDFFEFSRNNEWKSKILASDKLNLLNKQAFKQEMENLIDDLSKYQEQFSSSTNLNGRIYIYLYEEVLRKVFGASIYNMFAYADIRNPYLDFSFNSELLKYEIAGVYSEFFIKNPIKRYKGQVLYGHIMNKTSDILTNRKTGKGYKPSDLINYTGLFNISVNYIRKRLLRKFKRENLDYFSLVSGIDLHKDLFKQQVHNSSYFNSSNITPLLNQKYYNRGIKERDLFLLIFSVCQYLNLRNEEN